MPHSGRYRRFRILHRIGRRTLGTIVLILAFVVPSGLLLSKTAPEVPATGAAEAGWTSLMAPPGIYVVAVVLVLVLVIGVVYWRTAYLERIQEQLEREVAERTKEVERQKHQLLVYNRELLRSNDQLRRTIEEKSKLLGVAAHDLKNPLFGIRALSEIVLENESLDERGARKLRLIRESAAEAMALIDDLLASAAGTTPSQLDAEAVDVSALTQWVVHSFEPHAQRKDQALHCSVADATCVVEGDKRKLREAITNLVSNALKYSPSGHAVDVRVGREEGDVVVEVDDEGPGLSAADQSRMFAPFQRLSPTPTGNESSSGLGLYIVKKIVDLHDGVIEVDSAPGEGSTFRLRFPVVEAAADAIPEANPREMEDAA